MTIVKLNFKTLSLFQNSTLIYIALMVCITSCLESKNQTNVDRIVEDENIINILTENMEFQMPDTITSGWNTFRYKNASPQTHFFLIDKYPEGKTIKDAKEFVIPVFDSGMTLINEGKSDEGFAEFGKLPEWFGSVQFIGGSGLISPGHVGESILKLEPGYYIVECYLKMSNGKFHGAMGMVKELVVSELNSGETEPKADISINISSTEGIEYIEAIPSGKQTFSVYFKDQIKHEHFLGHDVNLAKLDDRANLKEIENWMNWADPKGFIEPAPIGVTFMGGINDMLAGNTGYFTANLTPGEYILISEVPNSMSKNMLKTFTISR